MTGRQRRRPIAVSPCLTILAGLSAAIVSDPAEVVSVGVLWYGQTVATAGVPSTFTLRASDALDRDIPHDDLAMLARKDARPHAISSQVEKTAEREWTVQYQATAAGGYRLELQLMAAGGLSASYFDNELFSGPARLTRTDARVGFDWGMHKLGGGASDKTAVRWHGAVRSTTSAWHTLHASTAEEKLRLWVDRELQLECWQVGVTRALICGY